MNGALDYKIWEPYKSLLPIPEEEISNNSALTQNPGYFDNFVINNLYQVVI